MLSGIESFSFVGHSKRTLLVRKLHVRQKQDTGALFNIAIDRGQIAGTRILLCRGHDGKTSGCNKRHDSH